ncbi:MAG: hypothetical protein ACRDR6_06650 [Pseudonocardiaceae bacterium]
MTIKLCDAPVLRELALKACPVGAAEARAEIAQSFAAVWQWAADPYAPMTDVQSIAWTPVNVTVGQILSR